MTRLKGILEELPEDNYKWHFALAAMRVEHLIWDRIISSEPAVIPEPQGISYVFD